MKRTLSVLIVLVGALWLATPAQAQTDLTRAAIPCLPPNTSTNCWRIHSDTTTTNTQVTLLGAVNASGGYKEAFQFAHPNRIVINQTNTAVPVAGTSQTIPASAGPTFVAMPYAGSVIAVSVSTSAAITLGGAHAEVVINHAGNATNTGLIALLDNAGQTQYNTASQARATSGSVFNAGDRVGCRMSTSSNLAPLTMGVVCTVVVSY